MCRGNVGSHILLPHLLYSHAAQINAMRFHRATTSNTNRHPTNVSIAAATSTAAQPNGQQEHRAMH
jgi:hypothetical protein